MKDKSERLIEIDGIQSCWCAREKNYQPCTNFIKNRKTSTGFQYVCKDCLSTNPGLDSMTEEDFGYTEVVEILTRLGYNLNGDEPVYKQFLKKHNL
jgi:hypothetical protein